MEIFDTFDQMSPEWMALRVGSIGGSSISKAVAKGEGKVRKQLMWDLVGELMSGKKKEGFVSFEMQEGMKYEPVARSFYVQHYEVEVRQVAIIKDGPHKHVSPDGLIGNQGSIEIKIAIPSVFAETKVTKKIATDRRKQMQWTLKRAQRSWIDYVMYCPYLLDDIFPMFVMRLERDEQEIATLEMGANEFIEEMLEIWKEALE